MCVPYGIRRAEPGRPFILLAVASHPGEGRGGAGREIERSPAQDESLIFRVVTYSTCPTFRVTSERLLEVESRGVRNFLKIKRKKR